MLVDKYSLVGSSEALDELKQRMTALEQSVNRSISLKTPSKVAISPDPPSGKRTSFEAFGADEPRRRSHAKNDDHHYSTPPFSTFEAQNLIQQELFLVPSINESKLTAFHSALSSLKQSLNTSFISSKSPDPPFSDEYLEGLPTPPVELIQSMLQCKIQTIYPWSHADRCKAEESGRNVCSGTDFMPFISKTTIARMACTLLNNEKKSVDLPSIICVSSYAGYFLQEIMLLRGGEPTGLEDQLRQQAVRYLATTRAWASRILRQYTNDLASLQALTYCVSTRHRTEYRP